MAEDGKIVIGTKVDESGLKQGIGHVKSSLGGLKASLVSLGIGAAVAGVTKEVVTAFGGFDDSMAKASSLFGGVNVDMQNLAGNILNLSDDVKIAASELNEGLYQALSAGVPVTEDMAEATQFLSDAARLAKAGFTEMPVAIDATAKTLNAYQLGLDSTNRVQNVLIRTQNLGITTVDELGRSLSNVTPIAASMGVSFEEVGAALALITAKGTPTAEATTQLRAVIAELGKEGTQASKALEQAATAAGLPVSSFTELKDAGYDLGQILDLMSGYADATDRSILDLFSSIEAGQAALSIASDAEKFANNLDHMRESSDAVTEAFNTMNSTLNSKLTGIANQMQNIFIGIGNSTSGALNSIADYISQFLTDVSDAFGENGFVGIIEVSIDNLGKLLPRLFNWGVDALVNLTDGISKNINTIGEGLFIAVGSLLKTVFDRTPELVGIGKRWLMALWDGIEQISDTFFTSISQFFNVIVQVWDYVDWESLGRDLINSIWNGIVEGVKNFNWFWIDDIWAYIKQKIKGGEETVTIGAKLETTIDQKSIDNVNDLVSVISDGMADAAHTAAEEGVGMFDTIVPAFETIMKQAEPEYTGIAIEVGENVAKATVEGFESVTPPVFKPIVPAPLKPWTFDIPTEDTPASGTVSPAKGVDATLSKIDKLKQESNGMIAVNKALGEEYYDVGARLDHLKSGYAELVSEGMKPFSFEMMGIYNQIQEMEEQMEQVKFIQTLTAGFQTVGVVVEDMFKAIAQGESAWAVFAKSALNAVAKVIESLGHELMAQAGIAFAEGAYGVAATTSAKALAAYASAGLIKGWAGAFATGGVVRGTYTGKDDQLALVQAGETILNRAQTQNMASLIRKLESGGMSGETIVVNFNGDVYGDEEQIATMVYNKTKTLQAEGRLGRW